MKLNKRKEGISLIVLVITIIVVIILAVAIILSLDGGGVISKATEVVEDLNKSEVEHIVSASKADWIIMPEAEKALYGKSFSTYVESNLKIPEDFVVEESGDVMNCMAVCDGIKCSSLEQLRNIIKSLKNETREIEIVLKQDIVIIDKLINIDIYSETTVILDLNGKKITGNVLLIDNYGDLTIKDSSVNKTGEIVAMGDTSKYNSIYDFNNNGIVDELDKNEVLNVVVGNLPTNPKYDFDNDGKVTIDDGLIVDKAKNGVFAIKNSDYDGYNDCESKLTIIDIAAEKIKCYPTAIQNYGTVIGTTDYWDFGL